MFILIILALFSAYLIGTGLLPPKMSKINFGIVLFLVTTVVGFIELKFWGILFLFAMAMVTLIFLAIKSSKLMAKISRSVDVEVAKNTYSKDQARHNTDSPTKFNQAIGKGKR